MSKELLKLSSVAQTGFEFLISRINGKEVNWDDEKQVLTIVGGFYDDPLICEIPYQDLEKALCNEVKLYHMNMKESK